MATAQPPTQTRRHYLLSALVAQRAAQQAVAARPRGVRAVLGVVKTHQIILARQGERAVALALAEQEIDVQADALLNSLAFTTSVDSFERMAADVDMDAEFERLVASLVQDAGRAAESVAVVARPNVAHVRYLQTPSCSRCAVLAGRIYRYSEGFQRHPNCDCVMIPVTVASPDFTVDPVELAREGRVTGLSEADLRALADGADFGQVVNVRSRAAGLRESGRVLTRVGRPTPEAIYRTTSTREEALAALERAGYLR